MWFDRIASAVSDDLQQVLVETLLGGLHVLVLDRTHSKLHCTQVIRAQLGQFKKKRKEKISIESRFEEMRLKKKKKKIKISYPNGDVNDLTGLVGAHDRAGCVFSARFVIANTVKRVPAHATFSTFI